MPGGSPKGFKPCIKQALRAPPLKEEGAAKAWGKLAAMIAVDTRTKVVCSMWNVSWGCVPRWEDPESLPSNRVPLA